MGQLPPNHDIGRVMASQSPQNAPQGAFNINLVVLVAILLLDGAKFLICEEDVFVPVLSGGDALLLSVGSPSKHE
jgi:hypothetical protein